MLTSYITRSSEKEKTWIKCLGNDGYIKAHVVKIKMQLILEMLLTNKHERSKETHY